MDQWLNRIIQGNALEVLRSMPGESVHCCVTSPPYWGLRDYGTEPQVWGGDPACEHIWGEEYQSDTRAYGAGIGKWQRVAAGRPHVKQSQGQFCQKCGAWQGNLGLEPSPELYIAHLVEIFREVKRVLRKDGCLWLNLGDSYVGSGGPGSQYYNAGKYKNKFIRHENPNKKCNGLKPKDLCGIPWRLALALQADGWWLRAAPPWVKKNGMPESCSDRPTTAHEYWFLLTKRSKYFWDAEAVKVACTSGPSDIKKMIESRPRIGGKHKILEDPFSKASKATNIGQKRSVGDPSGRNLRTSDFFYDSLDELISQQLEYLAHLLNVRDNGGMLLSEDDLPLALCINTISFPGSHFATFPPKLIEPIIQVSTSEHGCCPACGAPWVRNLAKGEPLQDWKARCGADSTGAYRGKATKEFDLAGVQNASEVKARILNGMVEKITIGWQPTCRCDAGEPVPAIVLDPFMGACTTALVSRKLGRNFVGAELKQEYIEMGEKRIATECAQMNLFQTVAPLNFLQRGEAA